MILCIFYEIYVYTFRNTFRVNEYAHDLVVVYLKGYSHKYTYAWIWYDVQGLLDVVILYVGRLVSPIESMSFSMSKVRLNVKKFFHKYELKSRIWTKWELCLASSGYFQWDGNSR